MERRSAQFGLSPEPSKIPSSTRKDQTQREQEGRGLNVGTSCTETDSAGEDWIHAVTSAQMAGVPSREVPRFSKHMSCHLEIRLNNEDSCFSLLLGAGGRGRE